MTNLGQYESSAAPRVALYALSTCSHCKAVKKLLDRLGVDYDSVDVDLLDGETRKETLAKMRRYNPRVTFPTTIIGGEAIVGNKPQAIQAKLIDRKGI